MRALTTALLMVAALVGAAATAAQTIAVHMNAEAMTLAPLTDLRTFK